MVSVLCVRLVPVANDPLISMPPLVPTYRTVRLVRRSRGAVTHIRLILGLVINLLHDLQVPLKRYRLVKVRVCATLWVVIVHGRTYEEHSELLVTRARALVTARVTWFVFRTVMPTPLLSVLNLVCPLPN